MTDVRLTIEQGKTAYVPLVEGAVTVEWERMNPGVLSFRVVNNGGLDFHEGNLVRLAVNGKPFFYGYVFQKSRNKDQIIQVTCYDQLRYFRNRIPYRYADQTASGVLRQLADLYGLTCGEVAETGFMLSRRENQMELFDILGTALEETRKNTLESYVLYDDCGKLTLKNVRDMRVNLLIGKDATEDFDYQSTIDGETYNSVYLYHMDGANEQITDEVTVRDEENVKRWGLLQLCDTAEDVALMKQQAKNLLELYNRKYRYLSLRGVLGDVRIRPGCTLPVQLTLGDINAEPDTFLTVEKVTHTFEAGSHRMDLTLSGGLFSA